MPIKIMGRVTVNNFMRKKDISQIKKAALSLAEDIRKTKRTIRINAGEGYLIYNHSEVKSALKEAGRRKVETKIIVGPVVFVEPIVRDNGVYRENGLLELAKEGVVSLYKRTKRTCEPHYKIFDDGDTNYQVEEYHSAATDFGMRRPKEEDVEDVSVLCKKFDEAIKKGEVCISEDPYNDFLLLSYGEIKEVSKRAEQDNKNFDNLTREEIEKYLQ